MPSRRARITALTVILRLAGLVTLTAFLAMLLPASWMASAHRALGFGDFPQTPVFEYLARSIAATVGVLIALLARDLRADGEPVDPGAQSGARLADVGAQG